MAGNDDGGRGSAGAQIILYDGPQRRPVQVVKVGMGYEHNIDGRQIAHVQAGTAQALEYEKPAREVGIDHNAAPANLHQEAGVADEGDAEFSVGGQTWL